jgi:hypothetical protein
LDFDFFLSFGSSFVSLFLDDFLGLSSTFSTFLTFFSSEGFLLDFFGFSITSGSTGAFLLDFFGFSTYSTTSFFFFSTFAGVFLARPSTIAV